MNWYFEEWYKEQDMLSLITDRDGAEAAWFYQQERIEELEREFEKQLGELEDELDYVKRLKELLEQRIIDLQGHDDLSYIDKRLSEREGQ